MCPYPKLPTDWMELYAIQIRWCVVPPMRHNHYIWRLGGVWGGIFGV